MAVVVLKLTADSAGMVSSLLPVKAAPAVPAPAPPPTMTAVRLPLPFWVTQYSSVPTLCGAPLTLMEVRRMAMIASPLNLPADLASETAPVTPAPAGITTLPLTAIPLASVPVKAWPSWVVLEESDSLMRTVTVFPAGMTIGSGGGGGGACSATRAAAGAAAGAAGCSAGAAEGCPGAAWGCGLAVGACCAD